MFYEIYEMLSVREQSVEQVTSTLIPTNEIMWIIRTVSVYGTHVVGARIPRRSLNFFSKLSVAP